MSRLKLTVSTILCLLIALAVGLSTQAAGVRHVVIDQLDWPNNLGLILEMGNDTKTDDDIAQFKTMSISFGLGTGTKWRFLTGTAKWEPNKEYAVKAVVAPDKAELWLDGKKKGSDKGTFAMFIANPTINGFPEWCTGQTAYGIFVKSIKVTTNTGNDFEATFEKDNYEAKMRPVNSESWKLAEDDTSFTIDFTFEIIPE